MRWPAVVPLLAAAHVSAAGSTEACRRIDVVEAATGAPLRGIEDIAHDRRSGTLYLAADDRWAVEDALAQGADRVPQGGVYTLSLAPGDLASRLRVRDVTAAFKLERDFHPQGIDLIATGQAGEALIAVVNRRRDGPTVEVFVRAGKALAHRETIADPALCRANDVLALSARELLVSNDGEACVGWRRLLDMLPGVRRGNVVALTRAEGDPASWTVRRIADGIGFANGLAAGEPDGRTLYVAATREFAIHIFRLERGVGGVPLRARRAGAIALDGGPDNLTWQDGPGTRLIVAVHPSLWRIGFYRNRWLGTTSAPSRIVSLDPDGTAREIVFDDPRGRLIPAATVALRVGDRLVIGAVAEAGLVVCSAS